jgi:hypothetical protein
MRKSIPAILPGQDALWTGERVEYGRSPAAECFVGGTRVHAAQFWCGGCLMYRGEWQQSPKRVLALAVGACAAHVRNRFAGTALQPFLK